MKLSRNIVGLAALVMLYSSPVFADYFSCDLDLNLIENADSTEKKQLVFDVELKEGVLETNGMLVNYSCYGAQQVRYQSRTAKVEFYKRDGKIHGNYVDRKLAIGRGLFNLDLKFDQAAEDSPNPDSLVTSGKLLPLNDEEFIHQMANGECRLSKEKIFNSNFIHCPEIQ